MSRVLAIDPGLRHCGVAVSDNGRLVACGLVASPDKRGRDGVAWAAMAKAVRGWAAEHGPFERVRSETPQVYLPGHQKKRVDPADLLQLQGVVGALCMAFDTVETIQPYAWKGQLPKDVCLYRIMSRLDDTELPVFGVVACAPSLRHNIADAVGILLDCLGRFK